MLVLSRLDVERLLDLDDLVDAVAEAMADLSAGRASMPPRVIAEVEQAAGLLAAMPAFLPSAEALTTKLLTVYPHNRGHPTHQALICCFEPDTGEPLALMDGNVVTAARTAAGSALATRLLARADARVAAIIGTGVQARSHARAIIRLPGIDRLRVAGRDPAEAQALADEFVAAGLPAEAAGSIEDAVRSADVVCATTNADRPVLRREWLAPGTARQLGRLQLCRAGRGRRRHHPRCARGGGVASHRPGTAAGGSRRAPWRHRTRRDRP